jgi:hypothetical protein
MGDYQPAAAEKRFAKPAPDAAPLWEGPWVNRIFVGAASAAMGIIGNAHRG